MLSQCLSKQTPTPKPDIVVPSVVEEEEVFIENKIIDKGESSIILNSVNKIFIFF